MFSELYRLSDGSYALRIKSIVSTDQRIPTHFILVIDTSDSMSDNNKLANVKHSASLVLHFLGQQDRLSIVTFGDDATIQARAVACTPEQKPVLADILSRIQTDGCTNLSAGLVQVREILANREQASIKTGVLLLTDGHANRGVTCADPLLSIIRVLHDTYPDVSLQVVGYGTDHNAELLKGFAETTQGAYSIVDDKEGAATVIGESLGSLFSCKAQQVSVSPGGQLEIEGTQFSVVGDPARIQIGDIYEGNETLLLFKPKSDATIWGITVQGTLLPSLEPFKSLHLLEDASANPGQELQNSVKLTRARYRLSQLFRDLREYRLGSARFQAILEGVEMLERELSDEALAGDSATAFLKAECNSLRNALETLEYGTRGEIAEMAIRTVAHEAFARSARGTVAALAPRHARVQEEDENPGPIASQYLTSPMASRTARRVTRLMATMSLGGEETEAAVHEAAEFSQQGPDL